MIHSEHPFEARRSHSTRAGDARVVHEKVQRKPSIEESPRARAHRLDIGQLEGQPLRPGVRPCRAYLVEDIAGSLGRAAGEEYMSAPACELDRRHPADSRVGSGDQSDASGENLGRRLRAASHPRQ